MSNPREEVRWFAEQMEKALAAKDELHGGNNWESSSDHFLITRLLEETVELMRAVECDSSTIAEIHKECADVANFAMMIADNWRDD